MTDGSTPGDEYRDKEIYDATGALLGTVADVDEEEGVLYVNPDPEFNEESWAAVGGDTFVNFDNNWLGIADYKVWSAGDGDSGADRDGGGPDAESEDVDPGAGSGSDAEFDEWPYTLSTEYVDEIEADRITLKH